MSKAPSYLTVLLLLFVSTFLSPTSLFALQNSQDVDLSELFNLSLEELLKVKIRSTSNFDEQPLGVAATVSVINMDDWGQLGARRPNEAIAHLPGMKVYPSFSAGETPKIRGYAQMLPRGQAVILDGVPLNTFDFGSGNYSYTYMGLGLLDNIEVIRGPGSVHYGTDAFHGVFSKNTFSAEYESSAAYTQLGSDSYMTQGIRNTSVLGIHTLNVGVEALRQGAQHIDYHYTLADSGLIESAQYQNEFEGYFSVAKLHSKWSDTLSSNIALYGNQWHAENFPSTGRFLDSINNHTVSVLKDNDLSNRKTDPFVMAKLGVDFKLTHETSLSSTAYYWRSNNIYVFGATPTVTQQWNTTESRQGTKITLKQNNTRWHTQWSVSLGHEQSKITDSSFENKRNGILFDSGSQPYEGMEREVSNIVYQGKTSFFDKRLYLHTGLRIDYYSRFGEHVSPRMGLVYHPSEKSALKLLYGNAFRAASAAEIAGIPSRVTGAEDIKPETIDTYELVYMRFFNSWKVESTLFHSVWRNGIVIVTDPTLISEPRSSYANTQENKSQGLELSLNYVLDQWGGDYSASYVRSEDVTANEQYVAFPRFIQNLGVTYAITSTNIKIYWSNRFESNVHENPNPSSDKLDVFWQSDLNIQYAKTQNLIINIDMQNIFNRNNVHPALQFTENGLPAEQRNLSIGLRYYF